MRLDLCTWPEVEAYLKRARGIIIPIGSTEQHGPNGLVGTDAICAEAVARAVGEELGALVAPTFPVGRAEHHMAFPGTITLRRSTMMAALYDWVRSLARHGFSHLLFINGHGGNIPVMRAAFGRIAARGVTPAGAEQPVRCRLHNWWTGPKVRRLARDLFGKSEGMHATPSEVSLTQHLHPQAIKRAEMHPRVAPTGAIAGPQTFRRRFPDGRIGSDPSLASPQAGRALLDAAVADAAAVYRKFIARDRA